MVLDDTEGAYSQVYGSHCEVRINFGDVLGCVRGCKIEGYLDWVPCKGRWKMMLSAEQREDEGSTSDDGQGDNRDKEWEGNIV